MAKFKGISKVIESYQKAPEHMKRNAEQWAAAGFFYTGKKDIVQCHSCDTILNARDDGRNPWKLHLVNSPDCLYVRLIEKHARPSSSESAAAKNSEVKESKYDLMSIISSYEDAPAVLKKLLSRLSLAGLFYTGRADTVECFCCRERFSDWCETYDPFQRHRQESPNCQYMPLVAQHNLIDAAGSQDMGTKIESFAKAEPKIKKMSVMFALAGYHYVEEAKGVYCRSCCSGWSSVPENEAFSLHNRHSPSCSYVTLVNSCDMLKLLYCNDLMENISSFDNAPELLKKHRRRLALGGFKYTGTSDIMRCNSCSKMFHKYVIGVDPYLLHILKSPNCKYVKAMQENNILELEGQHLATNVESYEDAPEFIKKLKLRYALAGFRFTPKRKYSSAITCLSCHMSIVTPSPDLDPWTAHKVYSPSCQYVIFADDSGLGRTLDEDFDRSNERTRSVESIQLDASATTDDNNCCTICMDNAREMALIPCGHASFCSECVENLSQCPLCREPLSGSLRIYQS